MSEFVFCGACGSRIETRARFCTECGASQEPFTAVPEAEAPSPETPATVGERESDPRGTRLDAGDAEHADGAGAGVGHGMRSGRWAEGHADPGDLLAELNDALTEVVQLPGIEAAPSGQLTGGPVGRLLRAAEAAFAAGLDDPAHAALWEACRPLSGVKQSVLMAAMMREHDREFRAHEIDGLAIRRVDFIGTGASIDDLGIELVSTPAGALIPRTTREGEAELITIAAADLQLFGPNYLDDDDEAARVHARGFDHDGLWHELHAMQYHLRTIRRMAWGVGLCVLTDRRAFGFINHPDGAPGWDGELSPERQAMPKTLVGLEQDGTPFGTVIVFSANRTLDLGDDVIEGPPENALRVPLIGGRMPEVLLDWGLVSLVMDVHRVVNARGEVAKPGKGQVAAAVERFAPKQSPSGR